MSSGVTGGVFEVEVLADIGVGAMGVSAGAGVMLAMSSGTNAAKSSADGGLPRASNSARSLGLLSSTKRTSLAVMSLPVSTSSSL